MLLHGAKINVRFKKTWTNCSTVSLLWFVQVFLNQTLIATGVRPKDCERKQVKLRCRYLLVLIWCMLLRASVILVCRPLGK